MDDTTDPVQPEGQGGEGGDSPYSDYLNRIPEEARSDVEPVFRDWDANVTKKFQEAADYRRGWEPFEQLGVNQRDPSEVEWGMQFVDALKNPNTIKEWYDEYARENGLAAMPATDVNGVEEYVDPQVAALQQQLQQLQGALAPQLAELTEWRSTQERNAAESQMQAQREQALEALRGKDDFDETLVTSLLHKYQSDPEHAVERAYADSQAIRSQILKSWTEEKANQPPAAQSGGVADGAPEPINTLKAANEMALAQLRAGRG